MHNEFITLEPMLVWKNFAQICEVPHPTGNEFKLVTFLQKFGKDLGLETITDEIGNVIIRKPATKGYEHMKTVTLQAHIDMVPAAIPSVTHNFDKDSIQAYLEDGWVKAKGTTLGADNGIGMAMIMGILQSKDIPHARIEALFTVGEEYELIGANKLADNVLQSEIMINLDSEEEEKVWVSSGGGIYTTAKLKFSQESIPRDMIVYKIFVHGLLGGHSGVEIGLGRGNANKIISWFLWYANRDFDMRICKLFGGELPNAIPREATAIIVLPKSKKDVFLQFAATFMRSMQHEFRNTDTGMQIDLMEEIQLPEFVIDRTTQNNLLNMLLICPDGVFKMNDDIPGLVESSTNLAKITWSQDTDTIELLTRQRSNSTNQLNRYSDMVKCAFACTGTIVDQYAFFPPWEANLNSPLLSIVKEIYTKKNNKLPIIAATHAGLECGIFKQKYPDMDIVSIGPTIENAHSPSERVNVQSVQRIWELLLNVLQHIPVAVKNN